MNGEIIDLDTAEVTAATEAKPEKRGLNVSAPGDNAIPLHFRYGASGAVQDDLDPILHRYDKGRMALVTTRKELMQRAAEVMKLYREKGGEVVVGEDGKPEIDADKLADLDLTDLPLDLADEALEVQYDEKKLTRRFTIEFFRAIIDTSRYESAHREKLELPATDPFWCELQDMALLRRYVRSFRQTFDI